MLTNVLEQYLQETLFCNFISNVTSPLLSRFWIIDYWMLWGRIYHNEIKQTSHPQVFLRKGVLKICSKFRGEDPYRSVISIKLLCNFIEIALQHACSFENLLHIFRIILPRNTYGWLLLDWKWLCPMYFEINITTSANNGSRSPKKASFCGSIRWAPYHGIFLNSMLFNSLFYFRILVWEFKIFTRCLWKWETQRVNTCLKLAMISLESSMSLNIPSNLLVKALPHSKKSAKTIIPFLKT